MDKFKDLSVELDQKTIQSSNEALPFFVNYETPLKTINERYLN